MGDCRKPRQSPVEQLARRTSAHVCDQTDATCIAFAGGVVQESLLVAQNGRRLSFGSVALSRRNEQKRFGEGALPPEI